MRSPYLANFRSQLSALNNHLSHYLFIWEQFAIDNNDIFIKHPTQQTTEIYRKNQFAKQNNVKIGKLKDTHLETSIFILKSLYVLIYSEFEVYIREFYEIARKINNNLPDLKTKDRIPDDIFVNLGLKANNHLEQEEIWTLDYLRLRRNRIVHSGGQSKGDLANIIKNKGHSLQKFWDKSIAKGIIGVDFQSEDTNKFIKEEIFDFIRIWRHLSTKIDQIFCQRITKQKLIEYLHREFVKSRSKEISGWGIEKAKSKFISFTNMTLGLILHEHDTKNLSFESNVA